MNLKVLLEQYQRDPRLAEMVEQLSIAHPRHFLLQNLQGSAPAFFFQAVYTKESCADWNHVVICEDAEAAAYFHNNLESLTSALNLYFFPSSFKKRNDFQTLHPSHVMLRTEALMYFSEAVSSGRRAGVLVTYPEALIEKVARAEAITPNLVRIKTGEWLDVDGLLEKLVSFGFERADFVYEPGQFALRGGILDIYSFGNEKPYRIELFGNEVDSIRIVDPETQLSERKLLQVTIIPNVQTKFEAAEKTSLFEFLPANTLIWCSGKNFTVEKLQLLEKELEQYFSSGKANTPPSVQEEDSPASLISRADFISARQVEDFLASRSCVEFGQLASVAPDTAVLLAFHTRTQPPFNRQFDLLIQDLKSWQDKGYSIYLFSENPRQLERLRAIFEDLHAEIQFVPVPVAIHEGFIDDDSKVVCYTDHQIFQRYHKYRVKQAYNKNKAITLRTLRELQPGDFITHIDHGVGIFSGLQKLEVNGKMQEAVRILYKDNDILYVNINALHKISKHTGKEGTVPRVNKLGSDTWSKLKEKTKSRVKEIAFDLIKLYAARKAQNGFAFSPDNYLQTELEASFVFEDTPDQSKATLDVKRDMQSSSPMDRLVCGDVGFGKTEVAIRAAFKACIDGKQAAILVPTTILAFQHYKTFQERLKDFPVTVDFVNRFKSSQEKKETLEKLEEGKIDIIIGTHALLGKEVKFKDLGLLVIDEEQKFGVGHKEKIKTLRTSIDCLTLTATPIPRTLQFSLMGARDLSIINTPPPNRQPIQTEVILFEEDQIREAIYFEAERGGQVFFIHNRVQTLPDRANLIRGLCPDLTVGYAHGQMEGHDLEKRILDFIDRKYDVLVCTNIVESGVDIPNVNTIIVDMAHQFGLSDLHQLRGRVGRSNKKAFCYLLAPSLTTLPSDSRKRLQTLEQHSELGSGFQIAMRDLDIRGAGNMLGGEQSGFMAEIGFEMYQKILDEAIRELKRSAFKNLFQEEISRQDDYVQDTTIDTDLEILIPDDYVENITERLSLYTRLDSCETEDELQQFHHELEDRFGKVPSQVEDLFDTLRCRKIAVALGFEKISLKDQTVKCFFVNKPDSPYFESPVFQGILAYIQQQTNRAHLKQTGRSFLLTVNGIGGMPDLLTFLQKMQRGVVGEPKETAGAKKA